MYGLEAETADGWCLPEAQLAISGIQVARAIYDTLMLPDEQGEYVPYLAEAVTPNDDYTKWTIELREGVKFHDGSDLTAEVVKNNLDAYRGAYPNRKPLLFIFVFENVADVQVTGPLTVEVATKTPWPAFPALLFGNGRVAIMAQAQLDDPESCNRKLIGTGPFKLKEWRVNDRLVAERNPDYWNQPYPFLDEIEFRPLPESSQRLNALQGGELDVMHSSRQLNVADLLDLAEAGEVDVVRGDTFGDVSYMLLNAAKPPFDNILARQALAYAVDRDMLNEIRSKGIAEVASGPFAPGNMGYLEDSGYPEYDLEKAKELVRRYEEETGRDLRFTITGNPDAENVATAELWKQMAEKAGMKVELRALEQAQEINEVLAGNFEADLWRNHAGGDPDLQYVWWKTGSPVNMGKFSDPEIDRLLDEGRQESDPTRRVEIYEQLNRRFAEQIHNLWTEWPIWAVATSTEISGVLGPDLPDGSKPFAGLADGHPVTGLWVRS